MIRKAAILPSVLMDSVETMSRSYVNAIPFPHIVLDEVFNAGMLDRVLEEFEEKDRLDQEGGWKAYEGRFEKKLQLSDELQFGPFTRDFIRELNAAPFLNWLESLTGICGLIPDPHLVGGGLHKIPRGGRLGVHIDFNRHQRLRLFRRLNVIVYLNKDWLEEYGGHFELWDEDKKECQKKVLPIFNRMAIFSTTQKSFHGHPEPLACPIGRFRRSLALYYYTAEECGSQSKKRHSTVFLDSNGDRVTDSIFRRGRAKLAKIFASAPRVIG